MNKQDLTELVERLRDCSRAIEQLISHLEAADDFSEATVDIALDVEVSSTADDLTANVTEMADAADKIIELQAEEVNEEVNTEVSDKAKSATESKPAAGANVQASAANPFARLFAGLNVSGGVPLGANPFNLLNQLAGGKAGLPSLNLGANLPGTLAELHDNPQIMGMISQVAGNPQSLNVLSGLTGQSPEALQSALASLQQTPGAAPTPQAAPAPPAPTLAPLPAAPVIAEPTATAHLDSLLTQWHWAPYARVWTR